MRPDLVSPVPSGESRMEATNAVLDRMRERPADPAVFWQGIQFSYGDFVSMIDAWNERLAAQAIGQGVVCGVLGDFSPQTCALLFALMRARAILVPFSYAAAPEVPRFEAIAGVQRLFRFSADDSWVIESLADGARNALVEQFAERDGSGLIVFTSGSTGRPKGILHDCELVMRKFVRERGGWRTVQFLMFDHFGGFNTLLSTFAYRGTAICLPQRTADAVCRAIEASQATLLPTTPTFLNLLLASGAYRQFDLSSIRLITYGTELMPEATLNRVRVAFPNARVKQTYGLSELGVLRSTSEDDRSTWVRVGGHGFETKIVDGLLWVRSEANMVGYLNAASPFDAEGWMCTGDEVEVRGDFLRFLGRKSEIINVGGQKVFPIEVETVLLQDPNVREATVFGVRHQVMGQVAHARVSLDRPEEAEALTERLRRLCVSQLARYKVPLRFVVVDAGAQLGSRYKKLRHGFEGGQVDR
jgi:long-chain acyl-CoA synthetase